MARTKINKGQISTSSEFESRTSGQLGLADGQIANAKLANDSVTVVAGDALTGGGEVDLGQSVTMNVAVDGAGIEIVSDALQLKDLGVTTAKLADDSVTEAKIGADAVKAEHIHSSVAGAGIAQNANGSLELDVRSEFLINGDQLQIQDAGIAPAFLHADVAGDALGQNASTKALEVKVDDSGIEIASDALQLKDGGVSTAKLAADAVTEAKIADDAVRKEHINADVAGLGIVQNADGSLDLNPDGAGLELSGDVLQIKDGAVAGTSNQLQLAYASGIHTVSFTNDVTMPNDLTVSGNLVVNGSTVTVESTTMAVEDNMIEVGKDNAADSLDLGFYGQYNDGTERFAGLFRDHNDGSFVLFDNLTTAPGNTVDKANSNMAKAELKVEKVYGDIQYDNARTFTISGDAAGSATFSGNNDPTIDVTIQAGAVEPGMLNANVAGEALGLDANSALEVNVDGSTIEIASDALRLKADGIQSSHIADDQVGKEHLRADVAGFGLLQDADGSLKLSPDGNSIEVDASTEELRVKDAGIITAKLADGAVTTAKIADGNVTNAKLQNDSLTFSYNGLSGPATAQALGSTVSFSVDQFGEAFGQGDMGDSDVNNNKLYDRFTLNPGAGKSVADNLKPMVFLNGILQEEGASADYQWDSANGYITFADALDADDRGSVIYFRK